jgi:chemotaxis protein histidine kinase CheA
LRDLDTRTLEPIEIGEEDEEDDMVQLPSPTPRKPRGKPSDFLLDEDENEIVIPRTPLQRPEGGHAFAVEGYSQEFVIYSDPKSKSPSVGQETPKAATQNELNEPPRSVSPSPVRKRRSSDAGLDSEAELTAVEHTPPKKKKPRAAAANKATGRATRAQKEKEVAAEKKVTTDALRSLLPSRKRNTKKLHDIFELSTATEEEELAEDEDELAPRRKTRKAKGSAAQAKKTTVKAKGKSKETTTAKANAAETPATKQPASTRKTPSNTYSKKAAANEKAADGGDEGSSGLSEPPSSDPTCTGSEHGHWLEDMEVRKRMKQVRKKFQEVDQWPLEFEDVSPSQASELDVR